MFDKLKKRLSKRKKSTEQEKKSSMEETLPSFNFDSSFPCLAPPPHVGCCKSGRTKRVERHVSFSDAEPEVVGTSYDFNDATKSETNPRRETPLEQTSIEEHSESESNSDEEPSTKEEQKITSIDPITSVAVAAQ